MPSVEVLRGRAVSAADLAKFWGWRRGSRRALYEAQKRLRLFERRTPVTTWEQVPDPGELAWSALPFGGDRVEALRAGLAAAPFDTERVLELRNGTVRFFNGHAVPIGSPPDFLRDALTGKRYDTAAHWSRTAHRGAEDIKLLWEPSRFHWSFDLGRAFARTADPTVAERWWEWFETWCEQNPPNAGPNWSCGQEAAIRLMAVTFASALFQADPSTTPERRRLLQRFVRVSGERIQANIGYARLQRNNHYSSESTGLLTAALLLRDTAWGNEMLPVALGHVADSATLLVTEEGATTQDSLNYHRVLLHGLVWALALCRSSGIAPPQALVDGVRRAVGFLEVMVGPEAGNPPFFGANDGALILPLTSTPFEDFRPTISLGCAALGQAHEPDEGTLWLFGTSEANAASAAGAPMGGSAARGRTAVSRCGPWAAWHRGAARSTGTVQDQDLALVSYGGHPVVAGRGTWSYHGADKARGTGATTNALATSAASTRTVAAHAEGVTVVDAVADSAAPTGTDTIRLTVTDPGAVVRAHRVHLPSAGVDIAWCVRGAAELVSVDIEPAERFPTYRTATPAAQVVVTLRRTGDYVLETTFVASTVEADEGSDDDAAEPFRANESGGTGR